MLKLSFRAGRRREPIGIEFALDQAHLAQLQPGPQGQLAARTASITYPTDRAETLGTAQRLKPFLKQALAGARFVGRHVCVALPADRFRMLSVTYNTERHASDAAAILAVLADRIDGKLEDHIVDYVPIRSDKTDTNRVAIAIVAERCQVIEHLELLRASGVCADHLEVGPTAIRRLVTHIAGPREYNVLMINFGHRKSYLTLLSGRRLLFDQELEFGEDSIVQALCEGLQMEAGEALETARRYGVVRQQHALSDVVAEIARPILARLVQQLQRALLFAASESQGKTAQELMIVGSLARWPGMVQELTGLLNLPVVTISDPCDGFTTTTDPQLARPELAVAIGLALRGTTADGG